MFNSKKYNFDIHQEMNSFDFFDFVKLEKHHYKSGILVITNEQYILSYTNNHGKGDHFTTLARIFKDLNGGGNLNFKKAKNIIDEFSNKYVVSKLYFSYDDNNSGVMFFENLDNVNYKNYEVFVKFYKDYNDIIKAINIESNFFVSYYDEEKKCFINSNCLDELMYYLKKRNSNNEIDENKFDTTLDSKKQLAYIRRKK